MIKKMYRDHYIFTIPSNATVIWRYMDYWKFKDLITTNKLFLASIKKMGDEFEAEVPEIYKRFVIEKVRNEKGENWAKGVEITLRSDERLKRETYISSWNSKEHESYALWKIYTSDRTAIAIKSSIQRLIQALSIESNLEQNIGLINYYNGGDYVFRGNLYDKILNKWNYYAFEDELRIVTTLRAKDNNDLKTHPESININIDLNQLIESIYLAPNATKNEYEVISNLIQEFGLDKEIYISGIRDKWANY